MLKLYNFVQKNKIKFMKNVFAYSKNPLHNKDITINLQTHGLGPAEAASLSVASYTHTFFIHSKRRHVAI
jgi:hypothetical protein